MRNEPTYGHRETAGDHAQGAAYLGVVVVAMACCVAPAAEAVSRATPASQPINLSQTPGCSANPAIATAGDEVMVAWEEDDALWFSVGDGATWTQPGPIPDALGSQPALAGGPDGGFELVWSQYRDPRWNEDILHSRFANGAWTAPVIVAQTPGESAAPVIAAADDGTRFVVWVEGGPGATTLYGAFGSPRTSWAGSPLPGGGAGTSPDVVYTGGAWHVTWTRSRGDTGAADVLYRRRDPGGWSSTQVIHAGDQAAPEPSIAAGASGDLAIAWLAGSGTVSFSRRLDGIWCAPVAADGNETATGRPAVALTDAGAVAAWPRYSDVRLAREERGKWQSPTTALQLRARTRGVRLARLSTGLGLVAEGRGVRDASDIYYVDVLAPAPAATVTGAPPAPTLALATATAGATSSARVPYRSVVHLPVAIALQAITARR